MGWVIFWVLCGVASSIIGGNKGRSGFAWFLFGCLVGPICILLALMVSKQTQAERDAEGHAAWLANASPFGARWGDSGATGATGDTNGGGSHFGRRSS